jgi:hypothetical protein
LIEKDRQVDGRKEEKMCDKYIYQFCRSVRIDRGREIRYTDRSTD